MLPNSQQYLDRVEQTITQALDNHDTPERLTEAMKYSSLDGGKRIRALLSYAAGIALDAPLEKLDPAAAAIECIHSYSLIHDDLPAMDDDDLRRGKPTNHIAFDEATAILAGDSLLTLAFELITSSHQLTDIQARKIITMLASSAGQAGMVGGQMLDIQYTNQTLTLDVLEAIHHKKTGALIQAAVLCGAYCAEQLTKQQEAAFTNYAKSIGLAFQVIDDILDVEASTEALGKTKGADAARGKSTYPSLIGLQKSKELAEKLYQQAIESADSISDNTQLLVDIARFVVTRNH